MPIYAQGEINLAAQSVPNANVILVPPQFVFGGVPSNIIGHVGTASWGPVGVAIPFGSYGSYAVTFGPTINRLHDMGSQVALACAQGASAHFGVRVTDGTDSAATGVLGGTGGLTLVGKYTGSLGNGIKASIAAGSNAGTWKITVTAVGMPTETYDNIGKGKTGAALWTAIADAINVGLPSLLRGPSDLVIATAGSSTTAPVAGAVTLSGGTDGADAITAAQMLGVDAAPRTGLYALRGSKCAAVGIADFSDAGSLGALLAYARSTATLVVWSSPSGDTIANAAGTLDTAGVDDFAVKAIYGDWIVWADTVNGVAQRVSAPTGVVLGKYGAMGPQRSGLNKPILGIVGTQSTILGRKYEQSDFQALAAARMDVVSNQSPGGSYFSLRLGINTSSNKVLQDDSYPRTEFYLAKSIEIIAGIYVGENQTPSERRQAKVALIQFLQLQQDNGIIYRPDGGQAYQVIMDTSNNAQMAAALGHQSAYIKAQFGSIVRFFNISLEGGPSVTISDDIPTRQ